MLFQTNGKMGKKENNDFSCLHQVGQNTRTFLKILENQENTVEYNL